jgi:hypothetical protein
VLLASLSAVVGCGPERRGEDGAPIVETSRTPALGFVGSAMGIDPAFDAVPLRERIAREQAAAATDPRYLPRIHDTGPVLEKPGSMQARFSRNGASIALGLNAETEVRVALRAVGRGEVREEVSVADVQVAGPLVELARGDGVTEWWRSLPSGLEHGVTLDQRPAGDPR